MDILVCIILYQGSLALPVAKPEVYVAEYAVKVATASVVGVSPVGRS
jgi:hypothetical protein